MAKKMDKYFKVSVRVHNMTIDCNGIETLVKNATLALPDTETSNYRVVETCRVIHQWLFGTSFRNTLSERDRCECRSCGELGTNLSALLDSAGERRIVYKSNSYKEGRKSSYFAIIAEYVEN